jgi:hypothetical protein
MVNTQNLYIRLLRLGLYSSTAPQVDLSHSQLLLTRVDDYVVQLTHYNPNEEENRVAALLRTIRGCQLRFIQYEILACDGISDACFKESFHHDFKSGVEIVGSIIQTQTVKLTKVYPLKDLFTHKTRFNSEFKAFQFVA